MKILKLTEKEYRCLSRVLKEYTGDTNVSKQELMELIQDFEEFVQRRGLTPRNDAELLLACNKFLRETDRIEYMRTAVVDQIVDYVNNNLA